MACCYMDSFEQSHKPGCMSMVSRIREVQPKVLRTRFTECFIVTRTGYYIGKHEEMKVKHKPLTLKEEKEVNKVVHEFLKNTHRHKEPPWVACPYCGETL